MIPVAQGTLIGGEQPPPPPPPQTAAYGGPPAYGGGYGSYPGYASGYQSTTGMPPPAQQLPSGMTPSRMAQKPQPQGAPAGGTWFEQSYCGGLSWCIGCFFLYVRQGPYPLALA